MSMSTTSEQTTKKIYREILSSNMVYRYLQILITQAQMEEANSNFVFSVGLPSCKSMSLDTGNTFVTYSLETHQNPKVKK